MAESEYKPFKSESFRKFVLELKEHGATVSCAVVYANGRMTTIGDPERGIMAFNAKKEGIPETGFLTKIPLFA